MLVCRQSYGHGNNKTGGEKKSILHPDLKTIPRQPQVQVIGNGTIYDYEGLAVRPPELLVTSDPQADQARHFALQEAKLKHPHHKTFHKTVVSPEDEAAGITRFYRWHIDAALVRPALPSKLDYTLLIRLFVALVRLVSSQGHHALRASSSEGREADCAMCVPCLLLVNIHRLLD